MPSSLYVHASAILSIMSNKTEPDISEKNSSDKGESTKAKEIARISSLLRSFGVANLAYAISLAERLDMTLSDLAAVEHIYTYGDLTPKQLANNLKMSTGSITALLDRLEEAGYLRRDPHPHDRRSLILHITDHAIEDIRHVQSEFVSEVHQILNRYSEDELQIIEDFLNKLIPVLVKHSHYRRLVKHND